MSGRCGSGSRCQPFSEVKTPPGYPSRPPCIYRGQAQEDLFYDCPEPRFYCRGGGTRRRRDQRMVGRGVTVEGEPRRSPQVKERATPAGCSGPPRRSASAVRFAVGVYFVYDSANLLAKIGIVLQKLILFNRNVNRCVSKKPGPSHAGFIARLFFSPPVLPVGAPGCQRPVLHRPFRREIPTPFITPLVYPPRSFTFPFGPERPCPVDDRQYHRSPDPPIARGCCRTLDLVRTCEAG